MRVSELKQEMDARFDQVDAQFKQVDATLVGAIDDHELPPRILERTRV